MSPRPDTRGWQHAAARPVRDASGQPAWQGIIVIEPDTVVWHCGHAHVVDPDNKGRSHDEAVACAKAHEVRLQDEGRTVSILGTRLAI